MNGFSRVRALQPVEREVVELVGEVAVLRHPLAVDVQPVAVRPVIALPLEADPAVEAGLRVVALQPHVPFADERGLVAGGLQIFGIEDEAGRDRVVVVHHPVLVRVEPGEDRRAARASTARW